MLVAMTNPFRYFNSSDDVIRLVVMIYVRYPLSLRNVEDLLAERGIEISHGTVRLWWNRFGPMSSAEIRKKRIAAHARLSAVALALGRGVRAGQRQALLSLARGRPWRRGLGGGSHRKGVCLTFARSSQTLEFAKDR